MIAGLCCCDHWEKWNDWKPEDYAVSAESVRSQIRRLRAHPSVMSFWYGRMQARSRRFAVVTGRAYRPRSSGSDAAS